MATAASGKLGHLKSELAVRGYTRLLKKKRTGYTIPASRTSRHATGSPRTESRQTLAATRISGLLAGRERACLVAGACTSAHLVDQWPLPMALSGGVEITTTPPSTSRPVMRHVMRQRATGTEGAKFVRLRSVIAPESMCPSTNS